MIWGIGLILFGGVTLLAAITSWRSLQTAVWPTLATVFLVAGIHARSALLMIPGGILSGVSSGVVLSELLHGMLTEARLGGIMLLALGVGFMLIMALQALFARHVHRWPIIVATPLLLIGGAVLIDGPMSACVRFLGYLWPAALIALGGWILWRTQHRVRCTS
jgi:hypothetical protein